MPERSESGSESARSPDSTERWAGHAPLVLIIAAFTFAVLGTVVGSVRLGLMMALVLLVASFATYIDEQRSIRRNVR